MEEQVGTLWHRLVTRLADEGHDNAAVSLASETRRLAVVFRALGGDGGLSIEAADSTRHGARRGWLQRLAGVGEKTARAWRDESALHLPPRIACFDEVTLNRDLYLWLATLAAVSHQMPSSGDWFTVNQGATVAALARFPGIEARYRRLAAAHLRQRIPPERLRADERAAEAALCQALRVPGSVESLPPSRRPLQPVPLWLYPHAPHAGAGSRVAGDGDEQGAKGREVREVEDLARRRTERADEPQRDRGLVTIRMESLLTVGEHIAVDRGTEEDEDLDRAETAARDLDVITLSRDRRGTAAKLRFDLDLPSAADDDRVLDDGILLPEWDWRRGELLPDRCRIVSLLADDAAPIALPAHLQRTAARLRHQFQALAPARTWFRARPDGAEIDLDACLRQRADRAAGHGEGGDRLYREMRSGARDLACLLLADLSLSTDTWVNDRQRVIDVIRDGLFLFAEALAATGDRFAVYGFSSRRRDPVRVHTIKSFTERYDAHVRGRIAAIRPGYYTRLGAGIRHATNLLKDQPAGRRLLLILTDGKPNDLDQYEGRYGIEDTRHAIRAARGLGLHPFCVTIDERAGDYLPHLFGAGGYIVIRRPSELPSRLPLLYARLTA